jgi:uncharacterized membrane protein
MALSDLFSNFHLFFRWLHVIAGITWIGHLYFFNFVNIPLQGALDDAGKKTVNPLLMPRALWWFRWGAMVTFVAGLILFTMNYMYTPGIGFGPTDLWSDPFGLTGRAIWITFGMLFGAIMWFNVWFIIWPAQKRILGLCNTPKATPEEAGPLRTRAAKASRINTYLSGPMLFGMLAASHYSAANLFTLIIYFLIGAVAIWVAYKHSIKVGAA